MVCILLFLVRERSKTTMVVFDGITFLFSFNPCGSSHSLRPVGMRKTQYTLSTTPMDANCYFHILWFTTILFGKVAWELYIVDPCQEFSAIQSFLDDSIN